MAAATAPTRYHGCGFRKAANRRTTRVSSAMKISSASALPRLALGRRGAGGGTDGSRSKAKSLMCWPPKTFPPPPRGKRRDAFLGERQGGLQQANPHTPRGSAPPRGGAPPAGPPLSPPRRGG